MARLWLQLPVDPSSTPSSEKGADEGYEKEECDEEEGDEDEEYAELKCEFDGDSPLMLVEERLEPQQQQSQRFSFMGFVATALRKSLVTCAVDPGEDKEDGCSSMDIGWPTEVRQIAHVTFDRFNGFLGLPVELETELPVKVPSASASAFGVSANSMQCSYDSSGNSVPTILLLMQKHLYSQGGLQAEGIFRVSGENGQELHARDQLNKGIVPDGIDSHCLASLIKAWFRELPTGVLDCLTPDQLMHCREEEEFSELVSLLPPMEAALLNWAINLMADVVQHECDNKMNARNIAMVFAPNMTQMSDPLTALIHAVQVMNLLRTLILKSLRERNTAVLKSYSEASSGREGSSSTGDKGCNSCIFDRGTMGEGNGSTAESEKHVGWITQGKGCNSCICERDVMAECITRSEPGSQSDLGESFHSFAEKCEAGEELRFMSVNCSPVACDKRAEVNTYDGRYADGTESFLDRFSFKTRVRKLCLNRVLQLSKSLKKSRDLGNVNSRGEGTISCA